jgi:hypothetical protein
MVIVRCEGCGREVRVSVDASGTEVSHETPPCRHFEQRAAELSRNLERLPDESRYKVVDE